MEETSNLLRNVNSQSPIFLTDNSPTGFIESGQIKDNVVRKEDIGFEYSTAMKVARAYMNSNQIIDSINKLRSREQQIAQTEVNEVELADDISNLNKILKTKACTTAKPNTKLPERVDDDIIQERSNKPSLSKGKNTLQGNKHEAQKQKKVPYKTTKSKEHPNTQSSKTSFTQSVNKPLPIGKV